MKLPVNDLDYIFKSTRPLWENLRNQRLFLTGGTGFFGCWLLESFLWANKNLKLQASARVLTRNIASFKKKCPHLFLEDSLVFQEGDVKDFEFPQGDFSYVIHAATDAYNHLDQDNEALLFDTIVQGTKHTLEFTRQSRAKGFLLTSSGAVYGKQSRDNTHIREEDFHFSMDSDTNLSAYSRGKRQAEELCNLYALQYNMNIKIARCFAFVGPHLPLDSHFAIGNFIRDSLKNGPIVVSGDGTPYRSYLYAADLAIWLWTILFQGKTLYPYNVGSDEALTIGELACKIANSVEPKIKIDMQEATSTLPSGRYVPDISRSRDELGLIPGIRLDEAIKSTINWYTHLEK